MIGTRYLGIKIINVQFAVQAHRGAKITTGAWIMTMRQGDREVSCAMAATWGWETLGTIRKI